MPESPAAYSTSWASSRPSWSSRASTISDLTPRSPMARAIATPCSTSTGAKRSKLSSRASDGAVLDGLTSTMPSAVAGAASAAAASLVTGPTTARTPAALSRW